MSNIKLNCCGCGKELGLDSRVSTDGVLWRCEECAIKQREEYDNKDKKISDLEAKLAENEKKHLLDETEWQDYCAFKHIEPQIKGCLDREKELKQQLAEKEKEIENIKLCRCVNCTNEYEFMLEGLVADLEKQIDKDDQDKISFAVEKIQDLKKNLRDKVCLMENDEHCYPQNAIHWQDVVALIDNQIKQLKEMK